FVLCNAISPVVATTGPAENTPIRAKAASGGDLLWGGVMGKPKRLTAEEWDACRYPGTMLPHLRSADARKLRLFVCACCRRIWDRLFDERSRRVVEAAELWADGLMTP